MLPGSITDVLVGVSTIDDGTSNATAAIRTRMRRLSRVVA
jgi:hypothetical protein